MLLNCMKKKQPSQSSKIEQLLCVFVQSAHTPHFIPGAAAVAAAATAAAAAATSQPLQAALSSAHECLIHPVLFH